MVREEVTGLAEWLDCGGHRRAELARRSCEEYRKLLAECARGLAIHRSRAAAVGAISAEMVEPKGGDTLVARLAQECKAQGRTPGVLLGLLLGEVDS
jgi:hypothetical protein